MTTTDLLGCFPLQSQYIDTKESQGKVFFSAPRNANSKKGRKAKQRKDNFSSPSSNHYLRFGFTHQPALASS